MAEPLRSLLCCPLVDDLCRVTLMKNSLSPTLFNSGMRGTITSPPPAMTQLLIFRPP